MRDRFDETGDLAFREQARTILSSEEPEVRRYPMLRYRFGAYEPLDEALSVLAAAGLVFRRREGTPGHTRQHNYYLTDKGRSVARDMIAEVPELKYYVDRVELLVEPSALKDMQYAQPEYADAEWHSRIQTIAPRVRERLAALDAQEQESS
jgi:DNA-binding HxlR family transcriptional regulator